MSTLPKPTNSRDIFSRSAKLGVQPAMCCTITTKQPDLALAATYGRRVVRHEARGMYQLSLVILGAGHMLSFECPGASLHELVTPGVANAVGVLASGAVASFPCPTEKDFEHRITVPGHSSTAGVRYLHSIQTEVLPEGLYHAALQEMQESGRESGALMRLWNDASPTAEGRCLSMLDVQRYAGEVHVQSYHFLAATGFVLRMQTIFEMVTAKPGGHGTRA